jgi:hypothetical protein
MTSHFLVGEFVLEYAAGAPRDCVAWERLRNLSSTLRAIVTRARVFESQTKVRCARPHIAGGERALIASRHRIAELRRTKRAEA